MEFIKNQQILGGIIKVTDYNNGIRNLHTKANLQLNQKVEKTIIINSLIEELQSIHKEIIVVDYFCNKPQLTAMLLSQVEDLNGIISSPNLDQIELRNALENIRYLVLDENSTQLDLIIERIDGCTKLKQDIDTSYLLTIKDFISFLFFCTCGIPLFREIPVEPEFGVINRLETPRITFKSFLNVIQGAIDELQQILIHDVPIRSFKLPNGAIKIQVKCNYRNENENLNKQNWYSRKIYKDLLVEHALILTFSLLNDLVQIDQRCTSGEKSFNEALASIRLQRKCCIERNVQAFMGWSDQANSYRSFKSIYRNPLALLTFLILTVLIVTGFYLEKNVVLFLFQSIDTVIATLLFGVLFYLLYLILYGRFSKNGQFEINTKDILQHSTNELHTIIDQKSKKTSPIEVLKTADNLNVKLAIYLPYLHPSIKVWLAQQLSINDSSDELLIEHLIAIIQKSEKSKFEKQIIEKIFPQQLIIIPAVNDENLIELVNGKIRSTDYPNVKFLIALEERDTKSLHLIHEAIYQGRLAPCLSYFFGPAELVNRPDQQRKPLNKPKNVNKTLSHFLNQLEGSIESQHTSEDLKQPDFIMIWDLEDDPGHNQLWSMIIAHTMISSTIDKVLSHSETSNDEQSFRFVSMKELSKTDKELFQHVVRFGIDVKLPQQLESLYKKALRKKRNNSEKEIENLINELGIKADIDTWYRAKTEIVYLEKAQPQDQDTNKDKLLAVQKELLAQISNKYATAQNFVREEFRRRMMPVDIQGILIARMYGESPMSPLEWEFWFDLVLPGLLAYRFDKLIFPLSLLGGIVGGFLGGASGVIGGALSMGFLGYIIGSLLLKLNIDVRNKVGLSFSAGTTNNFDFKTLVYIVSAYPEYNIAEDWSIALELNKMKFRSLLVNGYGTPTYEDSLAPLGPPMWSQHSRWMGGHIQSFPQVLLSPKEILNSYGCSNWVHSFILIVLFSLTPILAGFAILKFLIYGMIVLISKSFLLMGLNSYASLFIAAKDFIYNLTWWVPENLSSGLFFLLVGPVIIILLGMIPIFWKRTDDNIMVEKSISDLKRKKEEFEQQNNQDIKHLIKSIEGIKWISDMPDLQERDKVTHSNRKLNSFKNGYLQANDQNPVWNDYLMNKCRKKPVYQISSKAQLDRIVSSTKEKLNSLVQKDIDMLEKRIIQLEEGRFFHIKLGAQKLSLINRFIMNLGMIYYYLHSTFAIILYLKQMNLELDNQWRQTSHRTYGKNYYKMIQNILLNEIRQDNKKYAVHVAPISVTMIIVLLLILCGCQYPSRQFYSIHLNKNPVGLYELLEMDIQIDKEIKKVYDKGEIEIIAEVTGPDHEVKKIEAFYFQDYKKNIANEKEVFIKKGNPFWKIRYTPTKIGRHTYSVKIRYQGKAYLVPNGFFDVSDSPAKGYIRKGQCNYLQFDSKAPYFAVGMSVAWVDKFNTLAEYEYYFKKLKKNGCNYSRIWLVEWNIPIEWTNNGLAAGDVNGVGWYSQENSWKLDQVIELARKNGLYLLLTLGTYSDLMVTKGDWNEDKWHSNPYNIKNGGMCLSPGDFFTNEKAIDSYKKKLNYIVSRWGYSPNILAFELWNEYSSPVSWTKDISGYIKQIDPNKHLITTSLGFRKEDQNKITDSIRWNLPNLDYTQSHLYGKGDVQYFTKPISYQNQMMATKYRKPHIMAEFGIDYLNSDQKYDPKGNGIEIHNAAWTSIMTRSFGIAMTHWKEYVDSCNIYTHFKAISNFVENIDWNTNDFRKLNVEIQLTNDQYIPITFLPDGNWGRKTIVPIKIQTDGILTDSINKYIYGQSKKNEPYYCIPEFVVNYPINGEFILHIGEVSQGACLNLLIDGKKVWMHQFIVDGIKREWKSIIRSSKTGLCLANFDKSYRIPIQSGCHTIRIENSGIDWVEVKNIILENYQPKIEIFGLKGQKQIIGWVHNKESNWSDYLKKKKNKSIENVKLTVHDIKDGKYLIQYWNTMSGQVTREEIKYPLNNIINLSINQLDNDLAFKIIKL